MGRITGAGAGVLRRTAGTIGGFARSVVTSLCEAATVPLQTGAFLVDTSYRRLLDVPRARSTYPCLARRSAWLCTRPWTGRSSRFTNPGYRTYRPRRSSAWRARCATPWPCTRDADGCRIRLRIIGHHHRSSRRTSRRRDAERSGTSGSRSRAATSRTRASRAANAGWTPRRTESLVRGCCATSRPDRGSCWSTDRQWVTLGSTCSRSEPCGSIATWDST